MNDIRHLKGLILKVGCNRKIGIRLEAGKWIMCRIG